MLKVQKRTLPWGWYFMGFAMGRESEVGWGSCVWGRVAGRREEPGLQGKKGKSSPATGRKTPDQTCWFAVP